jgi:hypothetical protein
MRRLVHVLIVLSMCIPSLAQSARRLTRSELHSRRQQWFRQQRATPEGYFPSGLRWKALQQLDQMMQAEESLQRAGTAIIPATPWSPIGPSSTSVFGEKPLAGCSRYWWTREIQAWFALEPMAAVCGRVETAAAPGHRLQTSSPRSVPSLSPSIPAMPTRSTSARA